MIIEVTDSAGTPIPNLELSLHWLKSTEICLIAIPFVWPDFPYGSPPPPHHRDERATTDPQGRAIIKWRPYWRCQGGIQLKASANVDLTVEGIGEEEANIAVVEQWGLIIPQSAAFVFDTEEQIKIPVMMYGENWDGKHLPLENVKGMLLKSWKNSWSNEMRTWSCRNIESFDLIPWFGTVCHENEKIQPEVLASLRNTCKTLWNLEASIQEISKYRKTYSRPYRTETVAALRKWLGESEADALSTESVLDDVNIRTQRYAAEAIEVIKPYFKTSDEAVSALEELRALGRPAIPDFPTFLAEATPRCRAGLLRALYCLGPSWSDVKWFVQNEDPEIVLAGYGASKNSMALADIPEALEGAQKLQKTLTDQRKQLEARDVVNTLEYRLKHER